MSTTVDIKCQACGALLACETRTPLWLLALGRVSFHANCLCGFKRSFWFVSAADVEKLMGAANSDAGR